jgi:hypothetical protein
MSYLPDLCKVRSGPGVQRLQPMDTADNCDLVPNPLPTEEVLLHSISSFQKY